MSVLSSIPSPLAARGHHITLTARSCAVFLGGVAGLLLLAHLVGQLMKFVAGRDTVYGLVPLFDLDQERSIPAMYSATLLLLAAFLLGVIARLQWREQAGERWAWLTLALGFLFMACDEAVSLHELLSRPVGELLGQTSEPLILLSWVLPSGALVVVLGALYLPFLWRLPAKYRKLFTLSGAMFVGGAVGMEIVDLLWLEVWGARDLIYNLLIMVEEGLEMFGAIAFIFSLLLYIEEFYPEAGLRFGEAV
ncbi:MAG: hypothetical protein JNM56_29830 [Planctomycetia bacterium]|nr:hypothetical protein [Planctomycetia bacterium]